MIGNLKPIVLPPVEVDFGILDKKFYRIQSRKVKFDVSYQKRNKIDIMVANLSSNEMDDIKDLCTKAYRALSFTGYALSLIHI